MLTQLRRRWWSLRNAMDSIPHLWWRTRGEQYLFDMSHPPVIG